MSSFVSRGSMKDTAIVCCFSVVLWLFIIVIAWPWPCSHSMLCRQLLLEFASAPLFCFETNDGRLTDGSCWRRSRRQTQLGCVKTQMIPDWLKWYHCDSGSRWNRWHCVQHTSNVLNKKIKLVLILFWCCLLTCRVVSHSTHIEWPCCVDQLLAHKRQIAACFHHFTLTDC